MEEFHAEGLATHGDPESCAASREGRSEALTGARAGRAIEPRNVGTHSADAVGRAEGNTPGGGSVRGGRPQGRSLPRLLWVTGHRGRHQYGRDTSQKTRGHIEGSFCEYGRARSPMPLGGKMIASPSP